MAETPSTMAPLGVRAPHFRLPDMVTGRIVSLDDYKTAPALLVMFICSHCPYVKHVREHLAQLVREYQARGVAAVAISSNDVAQFPEDGPDGMKEEARTVGYTFPYLFDQTQEVAKEYRAACTPDFFVFDKDRRLVYRGQMDDSRPSSDHPVTGKDLRAALDSVLAGRQVSADQKPSLGCNIKWKEKNAPEYAALVTK
ncbi:MAG TPA: thioredoxin family protein [Terriglobales bacterium]|nr:thioredoxin family protein [Terriglobales bacterium]